MLTLVLPLTAQLFGSASEATDWSADQVMLLGLAPRTCHSLRLLPARLCIQAAIVARNEGVSHPTEPREGTHSGLSSPSDAPRTRSMNRSLRRSAIWRPVLSNFGVRFEWLAAGHLASTSFRVELICSAQRFARGSSPMLK